MSSLQRHNKSPRSSPTAFPSDKSPWLAVCSSVSFFSTFSSSPSKCSRADRRLPAPAAPSDRRPIVISGPSGVGKGTLCRRLLDKYPDVFATTVSHTTRAPRPGEVEGSSYFFVSREMFEALITEDAFIEHTEFNGNLYGTSKQTVIDQTAKGSVVLLDIELEGVKQLREQQSKPGSQVNPRFVFLRPPNSEVLEARLRGRGTEDEASVQRRLVHAKAELEFAEAGGHDKIVTNDDLERAFQGLEEFIFDVE